MNAYDAGDDDWLISLLPVTADCIAHHYGNYVPLPGVMIHIRQAQYFHVIATRDAAQKHVSAPSFLF